MDRYNREERGRAGSERSGGGPGGGEPSGALGDFPWQDSGTGDPSSAPGGERSGSEPETSGAPGDFPWQEGAAGGAGDQPPQVWEEPSAVPPVASGGGTEPPGNPLAITGFILSLVMWVAAIVPYLGFVAWLLALTFSSIGLSRARKLGAPHKGLAIAGLCISLVGVLIALLIIFFLVGAVAVGS